MEKKEELKKETTVVTQTVAQPEEKVIMTKPVIKALKPRHSIRNLFLLIVFLLFAVSFTFLGIFVAREVVPAANQWLISHNFIHGQSQEQTSPFLPQGNQNNGAKGSAGLTIPEIVKKASPSVVSIAVMSADLNTQGGGVSQTSSKIGTGFIVDSMGIIVTNQHVVSDLSAQYQIVTQDNKTYKPKAIIRDDVSDIALIILDAKDMPALTMGDSDALEAGETVIAIGTPLGEFPGSVTVGVISGLGRSVTTGGGFWGKTKEYQNVIQTDAAVNPGNSGGPLLGLSGNVIGVNFATTSSAENISFALPINLIKMKLAEYKKNGKFLSPFLGVGFRMVTPQEATFYTVEPGALINSVSNGSPADKVGIEVGDIITKVNGTALTTSLSDVLGHLKIGDEVTLTVFRSDKKGSSQTLTVKATLVDRPSGI